MPVDRNNAGENRDKPERLPIDGHALRKAMERVLLDLGYAPGGGVTDHGALTGLPDDDHPQYAKVAAGAFTTSPLSSAATPVGSTDVARMQEVGDAIVTMGTYVDTNAVAKTSSNAIFNAALAAGDDQVPYFVDTGNAAQMTVTAFARTLLDDIDEAAALATLGANVIDDSGFSGSLLGSGVTSLQALADWIDANVVVLP